MDSLLAKNLSAAAKSHAALAAKIGETPLPDHISAVDTQFGAVPKITRDGKPLFVHSRFDPKKEAARFIDEIDAGQYDLFIAFGFGFGYHVEELLSRIGTGATLLVIERDAQILRACFESRDLLPLLSDPRLTVLLDPSEDDISVALRGKSTHRVSFLTHRGSHQLYPDYYANSRRIAKSYLSTKEVNIATLAKFEKTWSANIARNIGRIAALPGADAFFDKFKGLPAIVVAAGPSLSESIGFIRASKDRAVVIAVDTAFNLLARHGIEPHFCITVDPQVINARYFEGSRPGRTVLIADPTSHPSAYRLFGGRTAVTGMAFQMMQWIETITGKKGEIAHGGSVSTNACDFARRLGASPVIMVGQDLSFTGGYAHARGSYLDEQVNLRTDRFFNAQVFNRRQLTALPKIFVKGIRSPKVHTNQKMMIFLSWFERRHDSALVNATADGAFMQGVVHRRVEEIELPAHDTDISSLIDSIYGGALPAGGKRLAARKEIAARTRSMLESLEPLIPSLARAVRLSEELAGMMRAPGRDRGKVDYILKKLAETDELLGSLESVKDMIGFTIQRVIHTITEGYAIDEGESGLSSETAVAERSLYLYRGLHEGAVFNKKILQKMIAVLSHDPE